MNIASWGFQIRLLTALGVSLQPSKGNWSSLTQLVATIPSSGERSAELVTGSRWLYWPWAGTPDFVAHSASRVPADSGHPASVVQQPCGIEHIRLSGLLCMFFLSLLLSDREGIGAAHSAGFLGAEA
ncbi:hypothetical protein QBC39DRAFT_96 [Podospora conica]|nr:hypothetical protein QBC39DRAFT_96 [Schizothecium conicum]